MRTVEKNPSTGLYVAILAAVVTLSVTPSAFAANGVDLWTGGAGDNNWATGGNWTGVNAPPITGDTPAFGAQGSGSLTLNNNLTAATSFLGLTFNTGAPSFILNGNSITTTGGIVDYSINAETINLPIILSSTHSVNATNGGVMTLDGVISGSAVGITKTGGGAIVLNGSAQNTYTGTTTVSAGILQDNFSNLGSTANLISSSSALSLGGGTLQIIGNAGSTSSQSFASTALTAGASTISAAPSGTANPTVALGAITPVAGSVIVINGPAYSSAPTTTSGQTGSAGNGATTGLQPATATITTTSGTANQIFASATSGNADYYCYGTVGLYDFAAVSGSSPFTITAYSQISSSASGLGTSGDGSYYLDTTGFSVNNTVAQTHVEDIAASFNPSANTTSVGGYRYNFNGTITNQLSGVQSVCAVLVTPNVGANNDTIAEGSSGVLEPGLRSQNNSGSLPIYQNNIEGFLVFGVVLSDGKTAGGSWIQSGAGTVVYAAANTFTGTIYLDGGVSEIGADSGLGAPATGATVQMNGGAILGKNTFTLDNSGSNKRGIALGINGGSLAAINGTTMTVDGVISGANLLTIGIPANATNGEVANQVPGTGTGTANASVLATGTVALTGANTYSGGTILDGGTLSINTTGLGTGGLIFNGGALQWASGTSNDISSQATVINPAGGTLDVNGNSVTLANSIGSGSAGTLTVISSVAGGALNLKGANTYTGGTIINSGTLNANNSTGSATGPNSVTVNSGAALGGSGTIAGDVTWQSGALASFTMGSQLTVGAVTLNNNSAIINVPGTTPLQPGTYTLMNYNATGSTGSFNATPAYTGAGVTPGTSSVISTSNGTVTLTVTAIGGIARTWSGDGSVNTWDYTTTNWLDDGILDVYSDGDLVTFDDSGSDNPAIDLTTTLQPASVWVNAAQNYTFAGAGQISGTTALVKTNTGTLIILTPNTYSGVTTIGQGTLQVGDGATAGSVSTNVVQDAGSLVLDLPGNNTFANTITGAGSLTHAGSGTLTLTASNSYTGGTTITSGTLQLNTGAWIGSGAVTDNGALTFNSAGNSTVNALISGTGALNLTAGGTVSLTGNNTYSSGTAISSGTLLVNNTSGSGTGSGNVTVSGSGHLGGSGAINGAVIINSGATLTPGNPVGTFTVNNNLTANAGSILNFTLGTTSDKVVVNGNLSLSGTLNITNGTGYTTATYTLFTYTGTLAMGSLALNVPANTTAALVTNTPGQVNLVVQTLLTGIPAFPGALGFGQFAFGPRLTGVVYHITNTNDSGAGSFRDAVSQPNRFIVFDVGGTITLQSAVSCSSSLYIAGQTAPGGIAIIGHEVSFSVLTNDIVRYLRIRPGSIASSTEDAINMGDATNMIFDHDSLEFAPYNTIDATGNFTGGNQITMQNCILADPIGQQFNAHTEALGNNFSWFYNIFSSGHDRNPLAKINTVFINNIVNNFQAGYTVADTSGHFSHDIINNYFITGPATSSASDDFFQFDSNQSVYSIGNILDSSDNGTLGGSSASPGGGSIVLSSPWSSITTSSPIFSTTATYHDVVSLAGAFPADSVDQLVFIDVQSLGTVGMGGGLWTSQTSTGLPNNGYGNLTAGTAAVDSDGDGIPDYYEEATGSNPNAADSLTPGIGGYTKLENYLNWLAAPNAVTTTNAPVYIDLSQYARGYTNYTAVYSVNNPSNGTITVNGSLVDFTPNLGFTGLGGFQFIIKAGDGSAMTNTLSVCVTPYNAVPNYPLPLFSSLTTSGSGVAFAGSGGITNANFILLGSTNLTTPLANWIPLTTNVFDGNGNFNFTNPATTGQTQYYYLLELP